MLIAATTPSQVAFGCSIAPRPEAMRARISVLVNGQLRPELTARPGERERWRLVNACSSRFLRLRLDGQRLQLLGIDSGRQPLPESVDQVAWRRATGRTCW